MVTGEEARLYSVDGFTVVGGNPRAVVLPGNEEQAVKTVRTLLKRGEPFLVRGTGTSLSGASIPVNGEVVVSMARLNRILDWEGLEVTVGPGIANVMVTKNAPPHLFYAPDPSSYSVSSIGGNVSHDSGGIHVVKYGPTFNHVVGLRVLLPDGQLVDAGGRSVMDDAGIFVGAEGTLGVVLRARLRLTPRPDASVTLMGAFESLRNAGEAVVNTFNSGVVPAAMEMMDRNSVEAVERSKFRSGYPEAEAIVLVELDGYGPQVVEEVELTTMAFQSAGGKVTLAKEQAEADRLWRGRKGAFPAMGVVAPAYLTLDSNILVTKLPDVLEEISKISRRYGLKVANVFHAGDGNLHPLVPYDPSDPRGLEKALRAGREIVRVAVESGGVPSGEHGIGLEKVGFMGYYYTDEDLLAMRRVKDAFDPRHLLNRCKMLRLEGCQPVGPLRTLWEGD
ncbi:FAD-binding oxidoreductase [Sulfodiicoccus acidiphilus]|uniref:FAD-binding oxidoreductase n=1 Tax=Sulfodiicoccus acidiphilus TaxID=1670455 RepID=A0A348B4I2_9CREN|nr:FAD-binding oxidoreductase [Sulfodiicoccus acidiphilus]GGU05235.1 FAD-binding oxidoreductase [Sulfodiicoccus acidiphilus]